MPQPAIEGEKRTYNLPILHHIDHDPSNTHRVIGIGDSGKTVGEQVIVPAGEGKKRFLTQVTHTGYRSTRIDIALAPDLHDGAYVATEGSITTTTEMVEQADLPIAERVHQVATTQQREEIPAGTRVVIEKQRSASTPENEQRGGGRLILIFPEQERPDVEPAAES